MIELILLKSEAEISEETENSSDCVSTKLIPNQQAPQVLSLIKTTLEKLMNQTSHFAEAKEEKSDLFYYLFILYFIVKLTTFSI